MTHVSPAPAAGRPVAYVWEVADLDGAGTRAPAVTVRLPSGLYLATVMFQFVATGADLTGCGMDVPDDWNVTAGGLGPGPIAGLTSYSWIGVAVVEVTGGTWETEVFAETDGAAGTVAAVGALSFAPTLAGA